MNQVKGLLVIWVLFATVFGGCDKDDDAGKSRKITYEVTGNFTGTLFVSYTTQTGGTANEQVNFPWTKEITYNSNVTACILAVSGNGGVAGQKATIGVKRGGSPLPSTEVTADQSGSFSKAAPVVIL